MPIYIYRCPCGVKAQVFKAIAQLNREERCDQCSAVMTRQVAAPAVRGDYAGYTCPVSGDWIEGRRAHLENLKKTGCRVLEPGEKEQSLQRRREDNERFDEALAETAARAVFDMPSDKVEALAAEIDNGAEATFARY